MYDIMASVADMAKCTIHVNRSLAGSMASMMR